MKDINEFIKNKSVNEARQVQYRASVIGATDSESLPINVTILVDREDQKSFEVWAKKEEGNIFTHIEGGNIEY